MGWRPKQRGKGSMVSFLIAALLLRVLSLIFSVAFIAAVCFISACSA